MKKNLTLFFGLFICTMTFGQNISNDTTRSKASNFKILSKGINVGYRAGIKSKNNELMAGYYFDIIDIKRHRLVTFDNDLWSNFNRIGFNSTISYSTDLFALSYSTDIFQSMNKLRIVPASGLSIGYNDLFAIGLFYNHKFNSDIDYPDFAFKLIVRPSFINIIAQNPDGSKW